MELQLEKLKEIELNCILEPCKTNHYHHNHVKILMRSFKYWLKQDLIVPGINLNQTAENLYQAPFAVLSHNTADDPIFNYANRCAQTLFEQSWDAFMQMPSRLSAEPVSQTERSALLGRVSKQGFIEDYQGFRISASGQRFWIEAAIIWNLFDEVGGYCGQAACIKH